MVTATSCKVKRGVAKIVRDIGGKKGKRSLVTPDPLEVEDRLECCALA